jgi:hypothetical protein
MPCFWKKDLSTLHVTLKPLKPSCRYLAIASFLPLYYHYLVINPLPISSTIAPYFLYHRPPSLATNSSGSKSTRYVIAYYH